MDTYDPEGYVERVKKVVRAQLEGVDGTAKVEDTSHFNHSAIPDFVVSWPGERGIRRVYLRDSYDAINAANDEAYLAPLDPVLISLDAPPAEWLLEVGQSADEEAFPFLPAPPSMPPAHRTLVTDVHAVEVVRSSGEETTNPLATLIRANFIRGARGHVDEGRAEVLVADPEGSTTMGADLQGLIRETFAEDAAVRIARTARLMQLAVEADGDDLARGLADVTGHFSLAEMKHLLPWLLQQAPHDKAELWRHLGGLMSFADVESMRGELGDLDVSPLIWANLDRWEANWAYLGLAIPDDEEGDQQVRRPFWSFGRRALGIDVGGQRIYVARNGQLIKGRESSSSATWDAVAGPLGGYRLASVALRGIRRSVTVDAEQSPDVRGDVDEVAASLEDQYFVTHATVRVPAPGDKEGTSDIDVDFGASLLHSRGGASIGHLARVAAGVLNYRIAGDAIPDILLGGQLVPPPGAEVEAPAEIEEPVEAEAPAEAED